MFVAATTAIARDLAFLVASGELVPAKDLDCALVGHAQVQELLVTVHGGLVERRFRPKAARDVTMLDSDPVTLFGQLLRDHPHPVVNAATSDLLGEPAASAAGRAWQRILKNATVASYAWRDAESESLPRGPTAWTVLADSAAIAQILACVTPKLATAARQAGRDATARKLKRPACGALWRAGAEVRALAELGPLPPVPELRQRARWPVRVRQAEALPEAQARLRSLLRQSVWLRPDHLEQIAALQARCLMAVAPSLAGRQARAAARLAHASAQLVRNPGSFTALYEGDERALMQAQEIHDFITKYRFGAKTRLIPADLLGPYETWAAVVPATLQELSTAVDRHVWLRRWLAPDPANLGQWVPCHPRPNEPAGSIQLRSVPEPHLTTAANGLSRAANAAARTLRPLGWRTQAGPRPPTARHIPVPALPPRRRSAHPGARGQRL